MTEPAAPSYKDTLNLPKTAFDMKANLTQREPLMVQHWADQKLYAQIRQARKNGAKGKWVLHDGPPYANGDIHMGHLINKVLKDIVVKFRTMQGYDSPYVPGWDCHGLPIESAIQKAHGPKFREFTKDQIRKECRDYALKYVKLQGDSFQRLGVFGAFDNPYLTLDPKYEAGILEVLAELVSKDLVYRQKKPVHWCTNDRTALAEAELEYASKKDTSVYVNFKLTWPENVPETEELKTNIRREGGRFESHQNEDQYLTIWTTTPWTLPANRGVAVHPDTIYQFVRCRKDGRCFTTLIAEKLIEKVMKSAQIPNQDYQVIKFGKKTGKELVAIGLMYIHPLDPSRLQPVVLADYVTMEDGTGLVHTAPGHGKEDYQTGQKYNLEVYNPVLADGRYDDTVPEFLRGKTIWDANQLVIDKLKETGALFHHAEFSHDYPHCWRCKKPTIQRATEQWFVKASGESAPEGPRAVATGGAAAQQREAAAEPVDSSKKTSRPGGAEESAAHSHAASPLWQTAKNSVNSVQWIPEWGKNRIDGMLDTRPDWCISRQRSWGVPIPAFFDNDGNLLFTEKTVRTIAAYFKQHGADSWYTHTPQQLLGTEGDTYTDTAITTDGKIIPHFAFRISHLSKGSDILDVWFESGASHHAVLECTHPELGYPANMYLEGSDQHRGWFQSSLLEASGYKSEPPFKQVLTHGFVVDEKGRKMSKSEGNDIKVEAALKQYGADVLRLWVASVDYQNDIPCGPNLLKNTGEAYRKIRNTIRYLLGNLYDFNPATDAVEPHPHSIDAWMQTKVYAWADNILAAYDCYEFHNVFKQIYEFCNVEISAVYAKAAKDRLYCELPNSPKRRASQTVCYRALVHLIELSAPVLAFTAEEAWSELRKLPGCSNLEPSIHLRTIVVKEREKDDPKFKAVWAFILRNLVENGNRQLDDLKRNVGLGNPLDAEAVIVIPPDDIGSPLTANRIPAGEESQYCSPVVHNELKEHIKEYAQAIEDTLGVGLARSEYATKGNKWDIKIIDTRTKYPSCARSWKRRPDVGSDKNFPDLSARDAQVVRTLRNKT